MRWLIEPFNPLGFCHKLVTFGGLCLKGFLPLFLCVAVAASLVLCRFSSCDAGGLSSSV